MSTTVSGEHLIRQLKWRYATKQFDPARKISPADWAILEEALVLTASSCGLQPWRFLVIKDPAMRAKLLPASWGQGQIIAASHLVVFAATRNLGEADLDGLINRMAEVRGVTASSLAGYRGMMVGALLQGLDE